MDLFFNGLIFQKKNAALMASENFEECYLNVSCYYEIDCVDCKSDLSAVSSFVEDFWFSISL